MLRDQTLELPFVSHTLPSPWSFPSVCAFVCVGANERQTSSVAVDGGNTDLLFAITSPTNDKNGSRVSESHTLSRYIQNWWRDYLEMWKKGGGGFVCQQQDEPSKWIPKTSELPLLTRHCAHTGPRSAMFCAICVFTSSFWNSISQNFLLPIWPPSVGCCWCHIFASSAKNQSL